MRVDARSDQGSITVFVAVIATALVMVAGMAYDGGQVIATHSEARSIAQKAARAGAQHIDLDTLRETGTITVDTSAAQAAADAYLNAAGATGTVRVEGAAVTVAVTLTAAMRILPVADRSITATHTATATDATIGAP